MQTMELLLLQRMQMKNVSGIYDKGYDTFGCSGEIK